MAQSVLVTGASKGIGLAIAKALVNQGYKVLGTSRNPDRMTSPPQGIHFFSLDLTSKSSINSLIKSIGEVDILINNAGISQLGALEETPLAVFEKVMQVNVLGVIKLTQAFLPHIRAVQGTILNIGSMTGQFPVPFQSGYVASKYAIAGLTCSLRNELSHLGVKVVTIEPNDVKTEIEPDVTIKEGSIYADIVSKMKAKRDTNMAHAPSPEIIAKKVVEVLQSPNPSPRYAVGGMAPFLVFLKRLLPDKIVEILIRKTYNL